MNKLDLRKTKIICTIGPASSTVDQLKDLIDAGMNVARFNMSHGTHQEQLEKINNLRMAMEAKKKIVGILIDTKGPEIRTHKFDGGKTTVCSGEIVNIHMKEILGDKNNISVTYGGLINDVEVGGYILVDDGYLKLEIIEKDFEKMIIVTKASNTWSIKDRRGINVPDADLKLDFISKQDYDDINFACEVDADYIACSFTRNAKDLQEIEKIVRNENRNSHMQLIAKIENAQGIKNLDEIIQVADGVMVARGDMGVEIDGSQVPIIQKKIIKKCSQNGIISITATQMLETMTENITPTRAEVSDVANAVIDGTSAIMLSGETANGKHPKLVVETMSRIALEAETAIDTKKMARRFVNQPNDDRTAKFVAASTAQAVDELPVVGIICPSHSGYTARLIARLRADALIFAIVPNEKVARSLSLVWGVKSIIERDFYDFEELVEYGVNNMMNYKHLLKEKGDRVIVTAGIPLGVTTARTNTMRVVKFKDNPKWLDNWNN